MSTVPFPARGEVWLADLDPAYGHEQAGRRPVLVISVDSFNAGASGLAVIFQSRHGSAPFLFTSQLLRRKAACGSRVPSFATRSDPSTDDVCRYVGEQ
jgi:mRNA-degrading endonuclease toxin of MazEF toxin-antitoxin module